MIWRDLKPFQKMISVSILFLVAIALSLLLFKSSGAKYVPLCPGRVLQPSEIAEIRSYLDRLSIPFQEDRHKGLLVLSKYVDKVHYDLADHGTLKQEASKGFELFDTNTWIKGEKELQVLEMRALKGQLEKDLAMFEHIKNASVILDIPPPKTLNSSKYPTKASVILTLMAGAKLSPTELRAIINHLTGAVRGLEPHMIAISDTSGKLYKAIDPHNTQEPIQEASYIFEAHLESKIAELLTHLVGEEHFFTKVQATLDKETGNVNSLSMNVVIDKDQLSEAPEAYKTEIERQLAVFAQGYKLHAEPVVDFIPFEQPRLINKQITQKSPLVLLCTLFFIVVALICLIPLFKRIKKKRPHADASLFRMMTKVDLKKLADSIQQEDPQTIALMLSYLEPQRAEEMIAAFNVKLQEEVIYYLSELEKEQS